MDMGKNGAANENSSAKTSNPTPMATRFHDRSKGGAV